MPTTLPTRPEGLIDRIEIALVHIREAREELQECSRIASPRFQAARTQLQGARRLAKSSVEAGEQAKVSLTEGTVPLADGIPGRRGR